MKINISILTILVVLFLAQSSYAQPDPPQRPLAGTFRNTILINSASTTIVPRKSFEFHIRHRFGLIEPDRTVITNFLGMDGTSNIQFSFAFPLGNKTMIGVGRTRNDKTYNLNFKRVLLSQTEDNKIPFTVALYTNFDIKTNSFAKISSNAYFSDGVTPFKNKFNHRISYFTQLIFSKKIQNLISLQLSPAFIYQNLAEYNQDNYSYALPVSCAVKTGFYSSIIIEYAYLVNYTTENNLHPLSIAMEFGTAGHVFQVIATTSQALTEPELYTSTPTAYTKGNFLLGFNLRRTFRLKNKKNIEHTRIK
ncbi:MAG: hypothetical protein IPN36_03125 [Bacteroidetes bacterium]|jgi:hypothetical protein|nr:hypothetical protein [Bacteroidota bacterium]MBK9399869.1 hypothetical protein [Bacteroidota bacterium]